MGLQRHGYTEEQIGRIKEAYKILFRSKLGLNEALAKLKAEHGGHAGDRSPARRSSARASAGMTR